MKEKVDLTHEADLVLIYYQEKAAVYARVEAIEPDVKKGWFLVTLLLLTLPAQTVTWILRDEYINGEPYTMGGQSMRLEKVKRLEPAPETPADQNSQDEKKNAKHLRVIPFKKQKSE
jgi:hypothetical protein